MFCTSCGNQIAPGTVFCTNCGARAASAPVEAPVSAPAAEPQAVPFAPPAYTEPAYTEPAYAEPAAPYTPAPEYTQTTEQGMNFDFSSDNAQPAAAGKRYEYKVLSQKDKWFSGKFDPQVLEQALNAYAQQGWRVIDCATADITGFGATRQEFITVMEREI